MGQICTVGEPAVVPIAVDRPGGLMVDALVDAGFVVVPIHPNVVKACRSRYSTVHAESDPGDAYLLADLLRTDRHRFEPLRPLSDEVRALRAMVRGGCDPPHAVRTLARPWIRVLWRCWVDGVEYDTSKHTAARAREAAQSDRG